RPRPAGRPLTCCATATPSHCQHSYDPHARRRMGTSNKRPEGPCSPWGEGAPKGRMRGPSRVKKQVAPHQFGRTTCDRAIEVAPARSPVCAIVSRGLTSSPPREEAAVVGTSLTRLGSVAQCCCSCWWL